MTEQQKHILRQSWNKIVDNVRSEDIVDNLIQVIWYIPSFLCQVNKW